MTDINEQTQEPINTEETNTALGNTTTQAEVIPVPDKFKVVGADGSVDYQATLSKLSESYTGLEKRIGTGDLPPKSVDDYKIEREDFDFEQFKSDPINQSFLEEAHKRGITNTQLDFLVSEYDKRAVDLVGSSQQLDTDTVVSTLKEEWGSTYDQNMQSAYKAAIAAGLTNDELNDPMVGNNKALIKLAAYYGSQMNEDKPITGSVVYDDIESMMKSEAYFNPKHPEHNAVVRKINEAYVKGFSLKR